MANELEPFTYENIRNAKRRLHTLSLKGKTLPSYFEHFELERQLAIMIKGYEEWRDRERESDRKQHRAVLNKIYIKRYNIKKRKSHEAKKESVPNQSS